MAIFARIYSILIYSFMKKILITGGAGFIGSHVVRRFVQQYPHYEIFNLDKLTYAGNLQNLVDVEQAPNYHFIMGDICDTALVQSLFSKHELDGVIHLAAESHVDRSISHPMDFVQTNVLGTVNLLNAAKDAWGKSPLIKGFTMFQPMRYMALLGKTACLPKPPLTIPKAPIRLPKPPLTILCGPITTPMTSP